MDITHESERPRDLLYVSGLVALYGFYNESYIREPKDIRQDLGACFGSCSRFLLGHSKGVYTDEPNGNTTRFNNAPSLVSFKGFHIRVYTCPKPKTQNPKTKNNSTSGFLNVQGGFCFCTAFIGFRN